MNKTLFLIIIVGLLLATSVNAIILTQYQATMDNGHYVHPQNKGGQGFSINKGGTSYTIYNITLAFYAPSGTATAYTMDCAVRGVQSATNDTPNATQYGQNCTASFASNTLGTTAATATNKTMTCSGTKPVIRNNQTFSVNCQYKNTGATTVYQAVKNAGTYGFGHSITYNTPHASAWVYYSARDGTFKVEGMNGSLYTNNSFTVNVNYAYNLSDMSGATVKFYNRGILRSTKTSDASGNAVFTTSNTSLTTMNATIEKTSFYNFTLNNSQPTNSTISVNLSMRKMNITPYSLASGSLVATNYNCTNGGSRVFTNCLNVELLNTSSNVIWKKTGWNWKTSTISAGTSPSMSSYNITGVYNATINVTAINNITTASITNFSGWAYNYAYGLNTSFSTSTGKSIVPAITGNYLVHILAPGYSINFTTANVSVTANNTKKQFSLFTSSSIYIHIYEESNGTLITENISIIGLSTNDSFSGTTTSGEYYIDGLDADTYSITFSAANYTTRIYTVTVGNDTVQFLNVFLTNSTDKVTFTIRDSVSGVTIEGAGVSSFRLTGGSWAVVESHLTDVTGRTQFLYSEGIKYKFIVSMTGYATKIFYLDPVLFTSYTVNLQRTIILTNSSDYIGVDVLYSPKAYEVNDTGNFTIIFTSPDGSLESYGVTIEWPTSHSWSSTGTNANGGQFTHFFNLSTATGMDTFNVTYYYDSTTSGNRTFTVQYRIKGLIGTYSIERLKANHFGLGIFETILISVLLTGAIAGVATMIGGALIGGFLGLLFLGFFVYIGFIPIWATVITFLVGFIILAKKGGE